MHRSILATAVVAGIFGSLALSALRPTAFAHCEVPCGIYDDAARVTQMLEDVSTIEKATAQIRQLAGSHSAAGANQAARWIMTKEDHATRIQHTISQYFMTQRIKPSQENYHERLAEHHAVLLAAMKTKQTVDQNNVMALRTAVQALSKYYVADAGHDHDHAPVHAAAPVSGDHAHEHGHDHGG